MEKRRTLSTIITLFIGITIGFILTILIGVFQYQIFGCGRPLVGTETFGDIEISALKASNLDEGIDDPNIREILGMKKKGKLFLMIFQNKAGENTGLCLFNDKKSPVFDIESIIGSDRWWFAGYAGSNEAGKMVGDYLVDIDFDGHFDVKHVNDSNGKTISTSIFIDEGWLRVDGCNARKKVAELGQTKYVFDPNSGWR